MGLHLVTPATTEPVTRAEAKLFLRIDNTDEDATVDSLIVAARQYAETRTRRQFITATWLKTFSCLPFQLTLDYPPLIAVTTFQYYDLDGALQTLSSTQYLVDTVTEPGQVVRAYQVVWPFIRQRPDAVQVTYTAGYGSTAAYVPEGIKLAMKLLMGHWWENRETTAPGIVTNLPLAAEAILDSYSCGAYT